MRLTILPERLWWLLALIAAVYCVLLLFVYLRQDALLYYPGRYALDHEVMRARQVGFRMWPEEAPEYHGFLSVDAPEEPAGTILLFHGNAGTALDRYFYAHELAHLNCRLILAEYPAYGARSGVLREASFVSAAVAAARQAIDEFGDPLYVFGESMGCAMAAAVAASDVRVQGVVLITPWNALPELAQSIFWYLPVRMLVRDTYDNGQRLSGFRKQVAVVLAANDEIIPPKQGHTLYDSLLGPKKLWIIPGAGHNSWIRGVDAAWWSEVMGFVTGKDSDI